MILMEILLDLRCPFDFWPGLACWLLPCKLRLTNRKRVSCPSGVFFGRRAGLGVFAFHDTVIDRVDAI